MLPGLLIHDKRNLVLQEYANIIYDIIMSCAVLDIHARRSGQTDYVPIYAKTNPRDPPSTCRPTKKNGKLSIE